MRHVYVPVTAILLLSSVNRCLHAADQIQIGKAENRSSGEIVHRVSCPWQTGETLIRVLVPTDVKDSETLRVLFVLPVEGGEGRHWGDGLEEIRKLKLHDRHRLICVAPTFAQLPWYADHPTDLEIAQETYLLKAIVPAINRLYSTSGKSQDRLLLGFSKSGWGAVTLLLRHPDVFGKAAAWDAPLMMDTSGKYGSGPIFGTQKNFAHYQVSSLVNERGAELTGPPRLFHLGYDNFRDHHVRFEALLNKLNVPHVYQDGPKLPHHWNSGWVSDAVGWLVR
jgi:hypothetical protein